MDQITYLFRYLNPFYLILFIHHSYFKIKRLYKNNLPFQIVFVYFY